jgi:hypothetical protein
MTPAAAGVFSPTRVGTMSLGHRLVVPPHSGGGGALLGTEEQFERMCRYWLARVQGGRQGSAEALCSSATRSSRDSSRPA